MEKEQSIKQQYTNSQKDFCTPRNRVGTFPIGTTFEEMVSGTNNHFYNNVYLLIVT